jgi:hypothetical protein
MTTNEPTARDELILTVTQPVIELLATADDGLDSYELIAALKPMIAWPFFEALALAVDMCPIHLTDLDSCTDDDTLAFVDSDVLNTPPLVACRHYRIRP